MACMFIADARKTIKLWLLMHLATIITTTFMWMNNGNFVSLNFQGCLGSNTVVNRSSTITDNFLSLAVRIWHQLQKRAVNCIAWLVCGLVNMWWGWNWWLIWWQKHLQTVLRHFDMQCLRSFSMQTTLFRMVPLCITAVSGVTTEGESCRRMNAAYKDRARLLQMVQRWCLTYVTCLSVLVSPPVLLYCVSSCTHTCVQCWNLQIA